MSHDTPRAGPKGSNSDVQGALIQAGCVLYESHGLQGVSLREVAEHAGVNQAMVRYYFKDKSGFEVAMLDSGCKRLLAAIPDEEEFEITFRAAISALNSMPWLPILVLRTVHIGDSLREYFLTTHAPLLMAKFGAHLAIDTKFALLTVLSTLLFPQITRQVNGELLGIEFNDEFAADFAAYVNRLVNPDE